MKKEKVIPLLGEEKKKTNAGFIMSKKEKRAVSLEKESGGAGTKELPALGREGNEIMFLCEKGKLSCS